MNHVEGDTVGDMDLLRLRVLLGAVDKNLFLRIMFDNLFFRDCFFLDNALDRQCLFNRTFVALDWLPVEVLVGEEARHITEIHNGEVILSVLLVDASAPTDNLFEFGHGVHRCIEHNELHRLSIDTGGEHFRSCCNNWIRRLGICEVIYFELAVGVVASDTYDVPTV